MTEAIDTSKPTAQVRHPRRALWVGAFITLLAPPIGFAAYFIPMMIYSTVTDGFSLDGLGIGLQGLMFGSVMSFLLGGIPALICAGLVGFVVWRDGTFSYRAAAVFAVVASGAVALVLELGSYPDFEWRSMVSMLALLSVIGLASAMACRWLIEKAGLLPPASPKSE